MLWVFCVLRQPTKIVIINLWIITICDKYLIPNFVAGVVLVAEISKFRMQNSLVIYLYHVCCGSITRQRRRTN